MSGVGVGINRYQVPPQSPYSVPHQTFMSQAAGISGQRNEVIEGPDDWYNKFRVHPNGHVNPMSSAHSSSHSSLSSHSPINPLLNAYHHQT
jgi:hypothetical protein